MKGVELDSRADHDPQTDLNAARFIGDAGQERRRREGGEGRVQTGWNDGTRIVGLNVSRISTVLPLHHTPPQVNGFPSSVSS